MTEDFPQQPRQESIPDMDRRLQELEQSALEHERLGEHDYALELREEIAYLQETIDRQKKQQVTLRYPGQPYDPEQEIIEKEKLNRSSAQTHLDRIRKILKDEN